MIKNLFLLLVSLSLTGTVLAQNDDREKVEGTLQDFGPGTVLVEFRNGTRGPLSFDQTTTIRVRGEADQTILVPGRVIEVKGEVEPNGLALKDPSISVWMNGSGPEVRSQWGAYYMLKADRKKGTIPVVLVGRVISVSPLRFEAGNSIFSRYYFDDDVDATGKPTNPQEYPAIGKVFEVSLPDDQPVVVELGSDIASAGAKAEVTAFVRPRDGMIDTLFLFRKEPLDSKLITSSDANNKTRKGRQKRTDDAPMEKPTKAKRMRSNEDSTRKSDGNEKEQPPSSSSNPAETNFQFGLSMLKAGKITEANRYFDRALAADPSDAMVKKIEDAKKSAKKSSTR